MHCHHTTGKCKKCGKVLRPEPFIPIKIIPDNPYIPTYRKLVGG